MIYIRKFKTSDFNEFVPLEPLPNDEIYDPEFAQAIEDSELAVTGVRDGKVVGCGGVHPIDKDNGEMWLRLSEDCLNYKIDTLRWVRDGFEIIEKTYPFKQLSASVRCCFDQSIKLVEYLGFVKTEMRMHKGRPWFIYSKRIERDKLCLP